MAPTVASAARLAVSHYFSRSKEFASHPTSLKSLAHLFSPIRIIQLVSVLFYILFQGFLVFLFKPTPPTNPDQPLKHPRGRIAVIGTGITGISSAAHAIAHGFEVTLFESGPAPPGRALGGIWAHVNKTSGLQINSTLYRFFPSLIWSGTFPHRDEIIDAVVQIWKEYGLESRTKFDTHVTSVRRKAPSQKEREADNSDAIDGPSSKETPNKSPRSEWIVNDDESTVYDAVIVCIGTCGKPKVIKLDGMPEDFDYSSLDNDEKSGSHSPTAYSDAVKRGGPPSAFSNPIIHSSGLDDLTADKLKQYRRVVVIGSGASGVEACETLLEKFGDNSSDRPDITMIARSDKWFIPRNIIIDTLIACQPFGREMPLSFIPEFLLRKFHYRGVEWLAPKRKPLFAGTPVVNDDFLTHVKNGKIAYVQGSPECLTPDGAVQVKKRGSDEKQRVEADLIVMATGFDRPSLDFLSADDGTDLFPGAYQRPNLYLQNFCTQDWSVLMTNSSYLNAIGTVGHFHIGIYSRILFTFLLDPQARPSPKDMKLWVDVIGYIKRGASGGALSFFTYAELTIWLILFHVFRPDRIKWVLTIMQGWGVGLKGVE